MLAKPITAPLTTATSPNAKKKTPSRKRRGIDPPNNAKAAISAKTRHAKLPARIDRARVSR